MKFNALQNKCMTLMGRDWISSNTITDLESLCSLLTSLVP